MAGEFLEQDLDTPSEHDLDTCYGSKFLSAVDVGDRKIKTKIVKIRKEELRADNGKTRMKFVLFLEGIDKPMVLNATNKDEVVDKLGRNPTHWIGASIGLLVDPTVKFAGKVVKGLRLRVLLPPANSKPAPAPVNPAAPAAATAWPEEEGDPGFEPASQNFEPAT
jgi:hypothetical protein